MKKEWFVLLIVGVVSLGLCAHSRAVLPPPPSNQQPTVTLLWGDSSVTNLTVDVYQSTNLSVSTTDWFLLARVSHTNAYTMPATAPAGFLMATVVEQFLTIAWDYPSDLLSPSLFFNLYWRPDASTGWNFITNIPGANLTAGIVCGSNPGQYTLTASNADDFTESNFSNIISHTNSVGQNLRLQIKKP